jgi:hypothetical protein
MSRRLCTFHLTREPLHLLYRTAGDRGCVGCLRGVPRGCRASRAHSKT